MTLCVLDASVALAWAFEDEASSYADEVIEALKTANALVPLIWPLEVNNALVFGVRRGRFQEDDAVRFLTVLDTIPLTIDNEIARHELGHRILRLGLRYGLSSYDTRDPTHPPPWHRREPPALRRPSPLGSRSPRGERGTT